MVAAICVTLGDAVDLPSSTLIAAVVVKIPAVTSSLYFPVVVIPALLLVPLFGAVVVFFTP